jgi:hypothetical protein
MRGWGDRLPRGMVSAALAAALALSASTTLAPVAHGGTEDAVVDSVPVCAFSDRDITESSGLVDQGRFLLTVNDSGGGPVLYTVDKTTCDTVETTTFTDGDVSDVEALAPGRNGGVWVGDVGDNFGTRAALQVYDVQEDAATRFDLVYPDGPHNAEALLAHPRTGRLYVVTKAVLGATVYAAPTTLDTEEQNRLAEVGRVPGLVTDGAFLPDGRHIILRSYGSASVYTFPGLDEVGRMRLPAQEQGEGIAVGQSGAVLLSSEGAYSEVLRIVLPDQVARAAGLPGPATEAPRPAEGTERPGGPPPEAMSTQEGNAIWLGLGVLTVAVTGWLAFTVGRRRSPRRP